MANYILNRTDPLSPSITVDAGRANGPGNALSDTTLRMYGEGYPNWGEAVNENFVKLIESFASATPPINPLVGQLWYQVQLYQHDTSQAIGAGWWVYSPSSATWSMLDGTGVVATSATPPVSPSSGDYYYNTTDSKLYWWTQLYGQSELMWLDRAASMVNLSGGAPSSVPSQTLMIYTSGGTWASVSLAIVDSVAPSSPAPGTLWYDTVLDTLRVWDGVSWNTLVNGDNPVMSGNLDMDGNSIINVADAVNPTDALNQQTGDARYVNVIGDTMTGDLGLGANELLFANMSVNTGNGDVTVGPDVQFDVSGLIAAEQHVYVNVDGLNASSGDFTVGKGGLTVPTSTPLFTVHNGGEVSAGTAGYETLVVSDNILTNKKYVDDSVTGIVTSTIPGRQTIWVPAAAMIPRVTAGAGTSTLETTTNKVCLKSLTYDPASEEFSQFAITMPKSWDEGDVYAQVVWSHTTGATLFGVTWGIQAVAYTSGEALDVAFGTLQSVNQVGGTADTLYKTTTTSPITIAGTVQPEDTAVFQVVRQVSDAGDTLSIDARLHGVVIFYNTTAVNDA